MMCVQPPSYLVLRSAVVLLRGLIQPVRLRLSSQARVVRVAPGSIVTNALLVIQVRETSLEAAAAHSRS